MARQIDDLQLIAENYGKGALAAATAFRQMCDARTDRLQAPNWAIGERAGLKERMVRYYMALLDREGIIDRDADQPADCMQRANIYTWRGVTRRESVRIREARRRKRALQRERRLQYNQTKRARRQESLQQMVGRAIERGVFLGKQDYWRAQAHALAQAIECRALQGGTSTDMLVSAEVLKGLLRIRGPDG